MRVQETERVRPREAEQGRASESERASERERGREGGREGGRSREGGGGPRARGGGGGGGEGERSTARPTTPEVATAIKNTANASQLHPCHNRRSGTTSVSMLTIDACTITSLHS